MSLAKSEDTNVCCLIAKKQQGNLMSDNWHAQETHIKKQISGFNIDTCHLNMKSENLILYKMFEKENIK